MLQMKSPSPPDRRERPPALLPLEESPEESERNWSAIVAKTVGENNRRMSGEVRGNELERFAAPVGVTITSTVFMRSSHF